jgi:hypothetical protein
MAMIEFEDHDDDGRRDFLNYLATGKPPAATGGVTGALLTLLALCAIAAGSIVQTILLVSAGWT